MADPDELEIRSAALTAAPCGCAFLDWVERIGLTPAQAADPTTSFYVLIRALNSVSIWRGHYTAAVQKILAERPLLRPLARAVLVQPGAAWWFAPLDRQHQLWVKGQDGHAAPWRPVAPDRPASDWERYAQKPDWGLYTSTGSGGISAFLVGAAECSGDLGSLALPAVRDRLVVSASARVYEVDGPAAWRRLCLAYPAPGLASLAGGWSPTRRWCPTPRRWRGTGTGCTWGWAGC